MTAIRSEDVIQSVADALQYISYYHPPDYIANRARAYELEERNGPRNLDSGVSEIFLRFQAANVRPAKSKYTASGVRRSSAL